MYSLCFSCKYLLKASTTLRKFHKKTKIILKDLFLFVGGPKLRKWYGAPDRLPKDGDLAVEDDYENTGKMHGPVCIRKFRIIYIYLYDVQVTKKNVMRC